MASGLLMCRINRPDIWLHRPTRITRSTLAKTEPSTYGPLRLNHIAAEWQRSPAADMIVMNGVGGTLQAFGHMRPSATGFALSVRTTEILSDHSPTERKRYSSSAIELLAETHLTIDCKR